MKNVGKFMGKFTKIMLGSVSCVALIGLAGYYLSMGLNWITDGIMKFLETAAEYLMGNWVAVIVVVVAITLGSVLFEHGMAALVGWNKKRKEKKAAAKK